MRDAIERGDESTLRHSISRPEYWRLVGKAGRRVSIAHAAERLAVTEVNTWYVRGLAARLMDEGEEYCEVYRAAPATNPRAVVLVLDPCVTHATPSDESCGRRTPREHLRAQIRPTRWVNLTLSWHEGVLQCYAH